MARTMTSYARIYKVTSGSMDFGPIETTRFRELAYQRQGIGNWRVLDCNEGERRAIGPQYQTRRALLADFERFAARYGCR